MIHSIKKCLLLFRWLNIPSLAPPVSHSKAPKVRIWKASLFFWKLPRHWFTQTHEEQAANCLTTSPPCARAHTVRLGPCRVSGVQETLTSKAPSFLTPSTSIRAGKEQQLVQGQEWGGGGCLHLTMASPTWTGWKVSDQSLAKQARAGKVNR